MKKWFALGLLLISTMASAAIEAGKDYRVLPKPQPVADPGKVEVVEFFSYSCIHCLNLDAPLNAWSKRLPADVSFRKEHVVWGKNMEGLAKLFATVKLDAKREQLQPAAFQAVMQQRVNLGDEAVLGDWIKKQPGVNAAAFMQNYRSFGVSSYAGRAAQMTRDYAVQGTPMVVVGGKYAVEPAEPARLLQVVDELIAKVRAESKKK